MNELNSKQHGDQLMAKQAKKPDPEPGTVFRHNYRGEHFEMTAVLTDEGIRYKVVDELYASPTAAAKAIVGDQFINGRKFWHMDK